MPPRLHAHALTPWLIALLLVQLGGLANTWWVFSADGYLPAPFVYDKADSFMDFYHPLFWADHDGRYAVWQSVYPPLNFLILKLIGCVWLGGAGFTDGFAIRAAHPELQIVIAGIALGSAILAFRFGPFQTLLLRDRALLFAIFIFSPVFLFALERGNLIVLALPFLALALTRDGWTRMAAFAILINLKPYFVVLTLVYVAHRRFDFFILTGLLAAFIFLVTGLLLDANFLLFFENLFSFSQSGTVFSGREVLALPSSVSAFSYVAETMLRAGTPGRLLGYPLTLALTYLAPLTLAFVIVMSAIVLATGHNKPYHLLIAFLTVAIGNLGVWVGGYSMMFLIVLLPVFVTMRLRWIYLPCVLMILAPLDLIVLRSDIIGIQAVYLSGQSVEIEAAFGLGSLLRPCLNGLLFLSLTVELLLLFRRRTIDIRIPRSLTLQPINQNY